MKLPQKTVLLFFASANLICTPSKEQLHVFILAGQSNMVGWANAPSSELPGELKSEVRDVLVKFAGQPGAPHGWQPLKPGLGQPGSNMIGPEITFGRDMLKHFNGEKIALIKYAKDGTFLNVQWRPPSSGGETGLFYKGLIEEVKTDLKFLDEKYEAQLQGICWLQGEYDATEVSTAKNYETNLSNFINDVRKDLKLPGLRFVIAKIDSSRAWGEHKAVREAEDKVAASIANVDIFDTGDLPSDGAHYSTKGQLILGNRFAHAMSK